MKDLSPLKVLGIVAAVVFLAAAAAHKHRQTREADPRRVTGASGIVVLTTGWCGYCSQLKAALDKAKVPYSELDVEDGAAGENAYNAVGGRGVPVTVIGQNVVHGYNAPRLTSLLKELGHDVRLQ